MSQEVTLQDGTQIDLTMWHQKVAARSQWHVTPLSLHFRVPNPPTITMRAHRLDKDLAPIIMTIELTEADLVDWDDKAEEEVPASLEHIVTIAAGRIVNDIRSREADYNETPVLQQPQ